MGLIKQRQLMVKLATAKNLPRTVCQPSDPKKESNMNVSKTDGCFTNCSSSINYFINDMHNNQGDYKVFQTKQDTQ